MISVLYADDDDGMLEPGKLFLRKSGQGRIDSVASVTEALQKALQKIKSTSCDTIVADYPIQVIEWIVFLKKILAEFPDLSFIIFTNKTRKDVIIEGSDNGADLFVVQVYDSTDLREKTKTGKQLVYRYSEIITCLMDATRIINPNGKVIDSNNAIDEITGVKA
ncbi:MAG TPA: response regulator [Methanoregula sp.]|nr:response regulator [Methanoregula sp.]